MKSKFAETIKPITLLYMLLGAWWIVNLLQAGLTDIANDEAYYFIFAQTPAWGYFDHPPITAILVRMGTFLFGDNPFGIRFFFTILQPLYLLILFLIIKPEKPTAKDIYLFATVSAALPILQLYGFIAVPDAPLMVTAALFFLCYKSFTTKESIPNILLLGLSVALLAYSKYHGALVVLFTIVSNPRILLRPRLYIAAAVAALLIVPHIMWQYNNDWASFRYHLAGRNKQFRIEYITEYILNILAVFNPLFFPMYIQAWRKTKSGNLAERAIYCTMLSLIVFFLLSSIRGYVQPQWVIVSSFGFVALLFSYLRNHPKSRKYVITAAIITISLVAMFRVEMIWNPLKIKFEIFDNKESYNAIADQAQGRPVIFGGNYAIAAKYIYYTKQPAYCQAEMNYRTSQWQFIDNDTKFAGQQVLIETSPEKADTTLMLANGRKFSYTIGDAFTPTRKVHIEHSDIPKLLTKGEEMEITLTIRNPYSYDILLDNTTNKLVVALCKTKTKPFKEFGLLEREEVIPALGELRLTSVFTVTEQLSSGTYVMGFSIRHEKMGSWFNSRQFTVKIK